MDELAARLAFGVVAVVLKKLEDVVGAARRVVKLGICVFQLLHHVPVGLAGGPGHAELAGAVAAGMGLGSEAGQKVAEFHLSLGPFRQVVKDYFQICASYFDAVKRLPPAQIEAIDMARRGIHNEGARTLQERLEGKAEIDIDTARRLFTLICALVQE